MELWVDTIDLELIKNVSEMNILTGVTTNPSILGSADTIPETKIKQILDIQKGYIAVQVTAHDLAGMLAQARRLALLSGRIVIKIPVIPAGLKAIAILAKENIPTLATAIFTPSQVLLAALAGARYAAPYMGRIEEVTGRSREIIAEMMNIIVQQKYPLKLMAAAIHTVDQLTYCAQIGVPAITVPKETCQALLAIPPTTQKSLEIFAEDWLAGKHTAVNEIFK